MQRRLRITGSLLLLNWVVFLVVSVWTSKLQGNILWWLKLNWSGWLSDLSGMVTLGTLPGGSVWILWLMLSIGLSAVHWFTRPASEAPPKTIEATARKNLVANGDLMETRPELKEKILRLHQSLDKI